MSLITLVAPANIPPGSGFQDSLGTQANVDTTGRCTIDTTVARVEDFYAAGFTDAPDTASATRPTVTYAGMPYFDTTLASGVGRPIWRNAANTGWVDSTGTTV